MEMWKLTDAAGVYVQPQKHPMRAHFIGHWRGLALFVDLDLSANFDWMAVRELERHLGTGIGQAYKNVTNGGK